MNSFDIKKISVVIVGLNILKEGKYFALNKLVFLYKSLYI